MVRPMLSVFCPVCSVRLSVTLVYCGQTVACMKIKLGMEVGPDPGHIVLDGNPAALPKKGHSLPIVGPCRGQTAGWIKMPLGKKVDLC